MKKALPAFVLVLILFSPPLIKAAPSQNPIFATFEQVQELIANVKDELNQSIQNISDRLERNEQLAQNNQSDLAFLRQRTNALEDRIEAIESNAPEAIDFTFFQGEVSTAGERSPIFDAKGYTKLVFTYNTPSLPGSTGGMGVNLQVSPDGNNWYSQASWPEDRRSISQAFDVAGRYYRVSTSNTTLPAVAINAFGHFYTE